MSEYVTARWVGDPGAYGGRRSRTTFTYRAYLPDLLARLHLSIPGDVSLLISDAEGEIRVLNASPWTRGLEAVAPLLLRAESVASSRIEGLELSQRSLAWALFDPEAAHGIARSVAGNVQAMEAAIRIGDEDPAHPHRRCPLHSSHVARGHGRRCDRREDKRGTELDRRSP